MFGVEINIIAFLSTPNSILCQSYLSFGFIIRSLDSENSFSDTS